jgi:hypothetical protein
MRTWKGTWHNQHGSEIQITVDPDGRVHGTMAVSDGTARAQSFPLAGFARGDLIAFCVDFGRHGSVTSWTGHLVDPDGPEARIESLWHMATLVPHPQRRDERWKSVWTGADDFRRGPATSDPSRWSPQMILWE